MTSRNVLAGIVAIFALFVLASSVSAAVQVDEDGAVTVTSFELNGVEVLDDAVLADFSGSSVPVTVQFLADNLAGDVSEDVRVKAWISGDKSNSYVSERFDVLEGRTYTRAFNVPFPFDLDEEVDDEFVLNVLIESNNDGDLARIRADVTIQRQSYLVEILDVDMGTEVTAGEYLTVDVVLKNRGRQLAEDSFVEVSIPSLGVSDRGYLGDLSAVDQTDPDREDANERRLYLKVPSNTPAGLYVVEVNAFNDDSATTLQKKVVVRSAAEDTLVVSPVHSKSFSTGETGRYQLTLVNSGSKIQVYELIAEPSSGLDLEVSESVVAVPAGSSRTITFEASSVEEGKYSFDVVVNSGAQIVGAEEFTANVEGSSFGGTTGNATVVLTVILAIIFVVLLVVLIVLLTRKPERTEDLSESYY